MPPAEFEAKLITQPKGPLRGSLLDEFFQASGNLSIRSG
jgi:hypothetical protein